MTQDKIIAAAREAGWSEVQLNLASPADHVRLERFYAIAYRAGMERAAEICDEVAPLWDFHAVGPSVAGHCGSAIRAEAHAKNQTDGRATNG